ncbi:hypothetical protein HBH49_226850 [Parastagonospora nodorum]|nr:hypothetical protein HBH49_226850 [Parastagonospora nodorum]KAH5005991.1 hypothetical protein HBI74_222200 [Parastagonospora nodorum]KAH5669649.1 hypothetical protein HBI21_197070 [Parastagonospora nodorum]KAH5987679.1 hypothetical protein HBI84_203380 [Parastagonospora nodorum]KAH6427494.1 hypothetical protein HBI59_202700 [Parastagonospora nodorum]
MWEKRQNTRFLNGIPQDETATFSLFTNLAPTLTVVPPTFTTDVVSKLPWTWQSTSEEATDTNTSPTGTASPQTSNINVAPTTSSTPSQTPAIITDAPISSSPSKTTNLTSGAVAGIAIGALILGALFASMIAYLLHKHRSQNTSEAKYTPTAFSSSSVELGKHTEYTRVPQPPASRPLPSRLVGNGDIDLSLLPAPASASRIHSRLTSLFAQIHTHITTFYRDVPAPITPSMHSALAVFGDHVAPFLQDTPAPTAVLQHVLAAHILRITDPVDGEIWPRELVSFDTHTHTHGGDAMAKARCLHRRLAVGLYTAGPTSERFSTALVEAAQGFALCFFAWALPMAHEAERESDLERVMQLALETRVWLYGQEEEYEFVWEDVGRRGVVVVPRVSVRSTGEVVLEGRVVQI